jgi:hypothetical protein
MGLESGVLDLHLTKHASGAGCCVSAFRHALINGAIAPAFDEDM